MKKLLLTLLLVFYSATTHAYVTTEGEIDMMGAMTSSTGWDSWITLKGVSVLGSCRKAPEYGLILFRVKREKGEKEIYSSALTALTTKRKIILLINTSDIDKQGNCYISGLFFSRQ